MIEFRIGFAPCDDVVDFRIRLAENAHGVARRFQRALGRHLVGGGLIHGLLRGAAEGFHLLRAHEGDILQPQHARRGDQRRLRVQKIGTVDREENLVFLHFVTDVGIGFDDAALIGREDLHQEILIEVDVADSAPLRNERRRTDRLDLYRGDLLFAQIERRLGWKRPPPPPSKPPPVSERATPNRALRRRSLRPAAARSPPSIL